MGKNAVINGCIKVEKSVASIYRKLMKRFPEKEGFWKELFDDETEHLSFLRDVKALGLIDVMQRMASSPSPEIMNETVKMADEVTIKIAADSLSFKKALAMVLKLEESMVETYTNKMIANLISCDNEQSYKKVITDEKKHLNKIKKMMKSL